MTQEGTNVYASNSNGTGTISYDIGNDLSVLASKDTYSYTSEEKTKSAGGSVGTNGVQFNYDQSDASSKVRSTTYNNVDIIANNINIKTGNNTDIKGANVLAQATTDNSNNTIGGNIDMDIGNNLNIESLQDSYYAKSKSSNFGLNIGGGKTASGGNSASAGFNFGKTDSTTDSQWVNEQTSIIADNNVNIKVGTKKNAEGNTNIKGAVIASGKYKEVELPELEWKVDINTGETIKTKIVFEDNGNLNLATNTLTYQDLNDFYREETKGYNFGTSVGGNTDKGKANMAPNGSTTIGLTHTGQEREQITRATIGLGNITINSEPLTPTPLPQGARDILAGLNRNVNNSQEITKDIIIGALNGSMTIDNRVFTSDGRSSIANDFKNLPDNAIIATEGALSDTKLVLDTSADILGAIPLSPVWYSRKKPIPPHPFPSFGIGDEVMGESSFRRDQNNKPIPDEGYLNVYTQKNDDPMVSDRNILFRFLYAFVPAGKSMTDNHDIEMNKLQKEGVELTGNKKYEVPSSTLKKTIFPSFLETLYGIPGTILDFKNYGENYRKIKDSYNNGIPKNRTIIKDTNGKTIYNDSWRLKNDKK